MPKYKNINELPDSVKEHLPRHALEIYREAFNSAWEQYSDPSERKKARSRESTAHAVAWSAVKNEYKKADQGNWVHK